VWPPPDPIQASGTGKDVDLSVQLKFDYFNPEFKPEIEGR
jgi:hypothetical protein